jgi:hypothetical protein
MFPIDAIGGINPVGAGADAGAGGGSSVGAAIAGTAPPTANAVSRTAVHRQRGTAMDSP